ncbi:MAG: 4'-phosphopantetheinyl transferase family protein [Oscillospiraceae bacterium]
MKIVLLDAQAAKWAEVSGFADRISERRRKRIEDTKNEQKKALLLLSEMLVRKYLSDMTGTGESVIRFGSGEFGKPFAENVGTAQFSVSYSGGFVAAAFEDSPVGIDIQRIENMKMTTAKRFFTADEYGAVCKSAHPEHEFFRIWTAKEAYVKMLGMGLSMPLCSFSVLSDELKDLFRTLEINGMLLAVCCENFSEMDITTEQINYADLLGKMF